MSKLMQMLEKVELQAPPPLGFGRSRADSAPPSIAIMGRLTPNELAKSKGLADAPVDAFLLKLTEWKDGSLDKASKTLKDRLWGVELGTVDTETAAKLREAGCDFVVFEVEGSAAGLLGDEGLGKLMTTGPGITEEMARAIHGLPIDGVAFTPDGDLNPLTIKKLMDIEAERSLVDGAFVMATPVDLDPSDLEAFRNAGITGLLVALTSAKEVTALKDAIGKLPRRPEKPTRSSAIIPRLAQEPEFSEQEHEHEEPDEEFSLP